MRYYPVSLDLSEKDILVVGAGSVGQRKIAALLRVPLRSLTIVDPAPSAELLLAKEHSSHIHIYEKNFSPMDIEGKFLVFAATGDKTLNSSIALLCKEKNVLCNSADSPALGSFFVPACIEKNGLTVTVSTEGKSPALAKYLREELEAWLGNRYTPLLMLLAKIRPALLERGLTTDENSRVLRALVHSDLLEQLNQKDHAAAATTLRGILPIALHPKVGELLHDL